MWIFDLLLIIFGEENDFFDAFFLRLDNFAIFVTLLWRNL